MLFRRASGCCSGTWSIGAWTAASAAGLLGSACSWLPGSPGLLFVCTLPLWFGQASPAVPCTPSPRSSDLWSLATQVAAVPWALWVSRAKASPPQTCDSLSGYACALPPRDLFAFLFERQNCLEGAASGGEECNLEQIPRGCHSSPSLPLLASAPWAMHLEAWTEDHSLPRLPVRRWLPLGLCSARKPTSQALFVWNTLVLGKK